MRIHEIVLESEKETVKAFLKPFNLTYENDIDDTIVIIENNRIIATASSTRNIIKCIAIDPNYQGQNLLATLMSEMIRRLAKRDIYHYFVYTLDEQAHLFKALGLKNIVQTMTLALLEGGGDITQTLDAIKTSYKISNNKKACVVVNANPMTKGHYHLIKTVAEKHEEVLVFVVSENISVFPFDARFAIVKTACQDLKNVTVVPTGEYLVSYATFPKYFMKEEINIREEHAVVDVMVFKQYFMKLFNINHRYVGEEPYSDMTDIYNQVMTKYLNTAFTIIPRKTYEGTIISASMVRRLLKKNGLESIVSYVPEATLAFLKTSEGKEIIEQLKHYDYRH